MYSNFITSCLKVIYGLKNKAFGMVEMNVDVNLSEKQLTFKKCYTNPFPQDDWRIVKKKLARLCRFLCSKR